MATEAVKLKRKVDNQHRKSVQNEAQMKGKIATLGADLDKAETDANRTKIQTEINELQRNLDKHARESKARNEDTQEQIAAASSSPFPQRSIAAASSSQGPQQSTGTQQASVVEGPQQDSAVKGPQQAPAFKGPQQAPARPPARAPQG